MAKEITRRLISGFGANLTGQIVTVVVQFVGVPLLLRGWGAHLYGEWLILSAIPSYLSMSDLGFSLSASNDMTQLAARHDRRDALKVFHSLCALIFSCCASGLVLVASLVTFLPFNHWWHSTDLSAGSVRLVLLFLAAEVLVRLADGINLAGFRSSGDYAFHTTISVVTNLLQNLGLWLMVLCGFGPVGAAAIYFCIRCIALPATSALLIFRHRWLRFGVGQASLGELRRLTRPALANVGMPLASALNLQGMVFVVGLILGPLSVVAFSTLRTLTRLVLQFAATVYNATEPELAGAYALADHQLIERIFTHALRVGLWGAFSLSAGLLLFGRFILKVWTHGNVTMDPILLDWLLASSVATTVWYACLVLIRATNRHLGVATVFCVSAAGAIGLSAILLSVTGRLSDAGIALLAMDVAVAVYSLHIVSTIVGIDVGTLLFRAINPRPVIALTARVLRLF